MGFKGDRIGRFVLDRKVGRAIEGELWKARSESTEPPAVVRLFYDAEWAEALRASGVPRTPEGPNVCRALGASLETTPPFFAREYAEGASLREVLAARRYLPLSVAIPATVQLLRALAAFHKAGLAHLDLRPGNIFLDERAVLRIADPETEAYRQAVLARLFHKTRPFPEDWRERLLPYVPPEQKRGDVAGTAADMYALGVLLYEIFTGERPEGFEIRMPSQRDKRIPKIVDEIVIPALERSPRARTPNALGLAERFLEGVAKAGFVVAPTGDPIGWVKGTPWRASGMGEETGKFRADFKRMAQEEPPS